MKKHTILFITFCAIIIACKPKTTPETTEQSPKVNIIFDTDANNELDDQHALAYLLFNGNTFNVTGITVNATRKGGDIPQQYAEADRVMKLCAADGKIPLFKGANGSFPEISSHADSISFDGSDAVNFIIDQARIVTHPKLVVLAVGKLTTLALVLKKNPSIADNIRLVWLGSNYPDPGEYNLENDTASLNYILNSPVDFEMVTVRYGTPSGSGAVQATKQEVDERMPGKGPKISTPVTGRHGGTFYNFGDYSVDLFNHIDYSGNPPARALFDMVAVAIVKNPGWGHSREIPGPILINNLWVERPHNPRKVIIWENFDKEDILKDYYNSMDHYVLVGKNGE